MSGLKSCAPAAPAAAWFAQGAGKKERRHRGAFRRDRQVCVTKIRAAHMLPAFHRQWFQLLQRLSTKRMAGLRKHRYPVIQFTGMPGMTEDDIGAMVKLLSAERLGSFMRISGTERGALLLHDHTIHIASALMPVICLLEIGLRNAVCERLPSILGIRDWLSSPSLPFVWRASEMAKLIDAARQARQASYAKLTESEKKRLDRTAFPHGVPRTMGHRERSQARQRTLDVAQGQLISQLTLFFWKRLFSADYEDVLWKRGLRTLFPDKGLGRSAVASRLELVYQARN